MNLQEMFQLEGRVAVVTGGARHLGFDIAEILAEAGCDVVITSRSLEAAESAANDLHRRTGRQVKGMALDLTEVSRIEPFAATAWDWQGRVDIVVNNAGGGSGKSSAHLFERSIEDIVELIAINLTGTLLTCKAFAQRMANRHSGKIINIASIAGLIGRDRRMYQRNDMLGQPVDYAAAKAGVIGLTLDLAGLLTPMGICVNAISPGGFGPRELPEGFVREYSEGTPAGRMGRDGIDLKGAALYLASPASDYVTGHNLVVDGGFSFWH